MSIQPHDVRELLGKQSGTAPVSDEQVDRMVTVLNSHRATRRAEACGRTTRQPPAQRGRPPPDARARASVSCSGAA